MVQVDSVRFDRLEPLGTKEKFWYTTAEEPTRWMLFKIGRRGTGEDWAEKVACELCRLIGLPHVHYELALEIRDSIPGVICETCAPWPRSLVLGNELLGKNYSTYPLNKGPGYKDHEHTHEAVADVVAKLSPPPDPWHRGLPPEINTALEVFVGYVMLDAWIANQDRHHENWAALRVGGLSHLAPTFDHASSLARNLDDEEREDRLTTNDEGRSIGRFVCGARSAFYAEPKAKKPMTTIEAWQAFSQKSPQAAMIWRDQLRKIDDNAVQGLLEQVPQERLSPIGSEFTRRMLIENQRRLLSGDTK